MTQLEISQDSELQERISALSSELEALQKKHGETEKEQEDLLILLDELSTKRRRDKERLRAAGAEVSEDEDADGEDDGEDVDE